MQSQKQVKTFDALRLEDGKILASGSGAALPGHVLESAIRSYLGGHTSVVIRADGRNIMQINCWSGNDCCDRESDPQLESVDVRINPEAWLTR